jgi:4-oxalocrotonate tautomerase
MVQITMLAGRTVEQKRKIAQRVTDVVAEDAGTAREGIVVAFYEVSKESYSIAGQLIADKQK